MRTRIRFNLLALSACFCASSAWSQVVNDPNLQVTTLASGLVSPISAAFLGVDDLLVSEKASGKVKRIKNGIITEVLDLPVNSASERGMLGMVLHPDFPSNPSVYIYWSESTTGADSVDLSTVALRGNRLDQFTWNGANLVYAKTLWTNRSLQTDAGQPVRGNHNGGVIRFGPDKKLYLIIGDTGRRGWLQNNKQGPNPDDQFGGPKPDENRTTGVILRFNDDGSAPVDNPFFGFGLFSTINYVYAYGVRNSFGMAFDPFSGALWTEENGDDAFDEINKVGPGFNGGWVQVMGPLSRINQFRDIEVASGGIQQLRWPPERVATDPRLAERRMYVLPGSHYTDPQFSWKYAIATAGLCFQPSDALGAEYKGDLFVTEGRTTLLGGFIMKFDLTDDRSTLKFSDPLLNDRVADNAAKFDVKESESLVFGSGFGIAPSIEHSPTGTLIVVSLDKGAIYEIRKKNDGRPAPGGKHELP